MGMGVPGEVDTGTVFAILYCNIPPLADLPVGCAVPPVSGCAGLFGKRRQLRSLGRILGRCGKGMPQSDRGYTGHRRRRGHLGGKLLRGINWNGGEAGHMVVEPDGVPCRFTAARAAWEQYALANALKRITREAMERCRTAHFGHTVKKLEQISGRCLSGGSGMR